MKERLTRLDRIYQESPIFFITFCASQRRKVLAHESVHHDFCVFCEQAVARQIMVDRYVIMPDHVHFFVHLAEPEKLAGWIKSLKNSLSKTLRHAGVAAPHWQKGYFDHLVRSSAAYDAKWLYVRMNPVRHGLAREPEDWPFQGQVTCFSFE